MSSPFVSPLIPDTSLLSESTVSSNATPYTLVFGASFAPEKSSTAFFTFAVPVRDESAVNS